MNASTNGDTLIDDNLISWPVRGDRSRSNRVVEISLKKKTGEGGKTQTGVVDHARYAFSRDYGKLTNRRI